MKKEKEKEKGRQAEETAANAQQQAAETNNENNGAAEVETERETELEQLQATVALQNDKYIRLMAEFDNYRRRTAKERLELVEQADRDVLLGFLPVLDDCERALEALRKSDAPQVAIEGTELILTKLMAYLKSKGVTRIEAKGKEFDTDFHEAVAQFPAPSPEMKNKVVDVTENGYLLRGKVMRFAKVVVGI